MFTLVYVIATPVLSDAVKAANDICAATGMKPAIISNGVRNFRYNETDAAKMVSNTISVIKYSENNTIED